MPVYQEFDAFMINGLQGCWVRRPHFIQEEAFYENW